VVVAAGETEREPALTGVTEPIAWSIVKDVAFEVVHESVEDAPGAIDVGFAVSVQVGAGVGVVTVTIAVQCTVPPAPVAVPV